MRQYLLNKENFETFPPPGQCVIGLLGLLTDIDRRLQLYKLTSKHTFNSRSISSLDSERFWSSLQVN